MKKILSVTIALLLGGCGSRVVPLEAYDAAGNVIVNTSTVVGDASVAKEQAVMSAWRAYYNGMVALNQDSGTRIEFEMFEYAPGQFTQTMKSFSTRNAIELIPPPVAPSEHPVWGFLGTAVRTVTPYGFGYLAIDSMTGAFKSFADNAGDRYHGPVNMSQSHNTAGREQTFSGAGGLYQGPVENEPSGLEIGGEAWQDIPGCSSLESFNSGLCAQ